jgi:hypothetical protein
MVGGASDSRVSELEQEVARLKAEIGQQKAGENVMGELAFSGFKSFFHAYDPTLIAWKRSTTH